MGLTGLGYSLPASFRLRTTNSPFSDEKIRRRLQTGYWYFLGGMGIVFGIMAFVLNNPQARKNLYQYGSDTLMSGMLIVMFPTTQLLSAATTDEYARQHACYLVFFGALGMFFTSFLLPPGILVRRGMLPLSGMVLSQALICSAAPNPWFMQYFCLFGGALGLLSGWTMAHALYGKSFRQFEFIWHAFLAGFGSYVAMNGVHRQIAHGAGDRVYDPVYYSVSYFMPLEPERLYESYTWSEKDYSYRYGGEVVLIEDEDNDNKN